MDSPQPDPAADDTIDRVVDAWLRRDRIAVD
jgi:hypothetical protein